MSGTRAGRHGQTGTPNWRATSYPKPLAPIFGIDKPPLATTNDPVDKRGVIGQHNKFAQLAAVESIRAFYFPDVCSQKDPDIRVGTFTQQHGRDLLRRAIAKELPQSLFVVSDTMSFDQGDEISRCVTRQCRPGKVRIGGDKVFWTAMQVGEVAAPTARNQNFLAHPLGALEQRHPPPATACLDRAHKSGRTRAYHHYVEALLLGISNHARQPSRPITQLQRWDSSRLDL